MNKIFSKTFLISIILGICFILVMTSAYFVGNNTKKSCISFAERDNYWSEYLLSVNKRLLHFWKPPVVKSLRSAVIYLEIDKKGGFLRHKVLKPSRKKYFDESFKRLVDFAFPDLTLSEKGSNQQSEMLINFYSVPLGESCQLQGIVSCPYSCYKIPELLDIIRDNNIQRATEILVKGEKETFNNLVYPEIFQTGCASISVFNCSFVTKMPVIKENTIFSLEAYELETIHQLYDINDPVIYKAPLEVEYFIELINRGREVSMKPVNLSNKREYNHYIEKVVKFILPLNVRVKGFSLSDIKFSLTSGFISNNNEIYSYKILCPQKKTLRNIEKTKILKEFKSDSSLESKKFKQRNSCFYYFSRVK